MRRFPITIAATLAVTVGVQVQAQPAIDAGSIQALCAAGPEHAVAFDWTRPDAPGVADMLVDQGWNAGMNERGADALAAFAAAVAIDPQRPDAYWGLGAAASRAGLPDPVIDTCFGRAMVMLPDVAAVRAEYGHALALHERWPEAIAAYRAALVLDAGFINAHDGLSAALLASGDVSGAQAAHDRADALRAGE